MLYQKGNIPKSVYGSLLIHFKDKKIFTKFNTRPNGA